MTQNIKKNKDAFWFKHDCNARNDNKIISIRREFGLQGYGLYWCLIEILRETSDYKIEYNILPDIFYDLHINEDVANKFIKKCINLNLFKIVRGKFFSESLCLRMSKWDETSNKRAIAGSKGGRANAKQMLSKKEAKGVARREEEKREEEKRENKIKLGEFKNIFLSVQEEEKIKSLYGNKFDEAMQVLSNYIESNGKKYKSHYAVLNKSNWVYDRVIGKEETKENKETPYNAYA